MICGKTSLQNLFSVGGMRTFISPYSFVFVTVRGGRGMGARKGLLGARSNQRAAIFSPLDRVPKKALYIPGCSVHRKPDTTHASKELSSKINAAKGIVYVVKQEGVEWVSMFGLQGQQCARTRRCSDDYDARRSLCGRRWRCFIRESPGEAASRSAQFRGTQRRRTVAGLRGPGAGV